MINEIYIDNFRCLTNFRIKPGGFQLWLGDNGSGKTSVLDALRYIQRLMHGEHVENIFNRNSLTIWDKRLNQTIGFSLMIGDEAYKYELTMNKMARGKELWFSRQAESHVVVQPFPKVDALLPAEVMARGWENE